MSAINSWIVCAGTDRCTDMTIGEVTATVIGSKSFTASYGVLGNSAGLTT